MTKHSDDTTPRSTTQTARSHEILANRLNAHTTLTVADVADEIAAETHGRQLSNVDPQVVCDIYTGLCETVLPLLARASLVVYDEERDLVSLPGYGSDAPVDVFRHTLTWVDESEYQ